MLNYKLERYVISGFFLFMILYRSYSMVIFDKVFVVSLAEPRLPLLVEDAMRPNNPSADGSQVLYVHQDTRLDNRVIDLYI